LFIDFEIFVGVLS